MSDDIVLPALILIEHYGNNWADWTSYCKSLYGIFERDFIKTTVMFKGMPVRYHGKLIEGKASSFWHLVSEGNIEDERIPNPRRCERIAWPNHLVRLADSDKIPWWENNHNGDKRVVISWPDYTYVVILAKRKDYYLLYTAYPVEQVHRQNKHRKEHEEYIKDKR